MKNDKVRVAKLYEKVFSTPVNSPEREQAYSTLSESDKTAVFNLERDCMLGRITRQGIAEMKQEGNENHDSPKAHSKINHIALDRRENLYESSRI